MHNYSQANISVSVVGGSGYSGLELQRLLNKYPYVDVKGIFNSKIASEMSVKMNAEYN